MRSPQLRRTTTRACSGPSSKTDEPLQEFCAQQFDMWEYGVVISAQTVHDALLEAPKRRTCGADTLVAETWQAVAAADPRVCASLAWAMSRRLTNDARARDTTTTTTGSDTQDEARTRRYTTTDAHDNDHAQTHKDTTTQAKEAHRTQEGRKTQGAQGAGAGDGDPDHDNGRPAEDEVGNTTNTTRRAQGERAR